MTNRKTFTRLLIIFVIILLTLVAAFTVLTRGKNPALDTNPVGVVERAFHDAQRDRLLNAYIWYPTTETEAVTLLDDNVVFHGFTAIMTATTMPQQHPLIVLSHGSGGNRANQGWLATELARQGAIVVAANHPGSTSRDSAPATNILAWNRPKDITFLLDSMLSDAQFGGLIDADRIGMIGHSLGGYTALAVGGGVLSVDQFIDYCKDAPDAPDCAFYLGGGVDLTQIDRKQFEQPLRDERVDAVIAIDPAYARSFQLESLQDMSDVLLIAAESNGGFKTDISVESLATDLELHDDYIELADAHHFTFLPECKPLGYYLLMIFETDGELLCWPEEGSQRADLQASTQQLVIDFLQMQQILD